MYRVNFPEKGLLSKSKSNAKRHGQDFNLELSDIVIPKHCPLLGCELTYKQNNGRVWTNASIDRVDNSKGYVKGNIQIISDLANRMKQDASVEQLVNFAKGVLKKYEPTV